MDERSCYIFLNLLSLGYRTALKLKTEFGSLSEAVSADKQALLAVHGIRKNSAESIVSKRGMPLVEKELELADKSGFTVLTVGDEEYPQPLKNIDSPPLVLYINGTLTDQDASAIAIVGTRKPTSYGKTVAFNAGYDLAAQGVTVVSGLATGLDTEAHRGALKAEGRTLAVLGSGLLRLYPRENEKLARKIIGQGAVISEFPLETEPFRSNFPIRNRVISGLSSGTIVVEAAAKSGSLITAGFAAEQGRTVFAVPGNIDQPTSSGANRLINQGAVLYESVEDVFRELPYLRRKKNVTAEHPTDMKKSDVSLSSEEKKVVTLLSKKPLHIDELTEASDFNAPQLSVLLLTLEMKKVVAQLPGKYYTLSQNLVTLELT
ncbi:MAG: DNA-processing protein DprA [Candidatus Auribacterota bacterium]|jgi:DNA processing protein|nr:DNA-processing protein DprA [Candidatus Auribacterota bacterium]